VSRLTGRLAAALVLVVAALGGASAAPARAASAAPQLFVVADSVGLSAKDAIPRAFGGWNVAVVGRPAVFTDVAVTDYVAPAGALPEVAVVATGYNYPFWDPDRFDRSVDAMVDALVARGVRHVVWVTLREVKPQYISASAWAQVQPYYWYFPTVNQHLRAALPRHPELVLADWAAIADEPGLSYDAIHLNTTGAARYARLLRTEVDGFTRLKAGRTLAIQVTGVAGGPGDAAAVALNVTVTDPKYAGYVTVSPCGATAGTSNLNYEWDTTVANHALVKPGPDGRVCVSTFADAHVLVDRTGWIPAAGSGFVGITPTRAYDSRTGAPIPPGGTATVALAGVGVPGDAAAVVLNVTAVDPAGPGYLGVTPCPARAGDVSSVNYVAGQTVADLAVTPLGPGGTVCVSSFASSHVLVDVMGWFAAGSSYTSVPPHRIVDTRQAQGAAAGPLGAGTVLALDLAALGGVPAGAPATALTVTAADPRADGYLTVFPCGTTVPVASDLNYPAGANVPALTLAPLAADGRVCIFTYAATDVVVDLAGWIPPGGAYTGTTPTRLVDTRLQDPNVP
jgi:hypothetical protein